MIAGIAAEFKNPKELIAAVKAVREAGYTRFEPYSSFPIHGMDRAMGIKDTSLGWIVLSCGSLGLLTGFLLQTWVSVWTNPFIISGKPLFSYQAFVPVMFELTILFSAFGAVFGMLILSNLPKPYHPLFKHSRFYTVSSHTFYLEIDALDPKFEKDNTSAFLKEIGGQYVETYSE